MRKTNLLVAVAALTIFSCKKNTKDLPLNESASSADLTICYSDLWSEDTEMISNGNAPCLVYNNKTYFFNRIGETPTSHGNTVTIYDGTSWQTRHTAVPDYFNVLSDIQFVIGNKGYLGTTFGGFWEYNFLTNAWARKADFPGEPRRITAHFSIGTKGYIVGGFVFKDNDGVNYGDTWEYNPATDTWTKKANFSTLGKGGMEGFSIGNKGYMVNGVRNPGSDAQYFNTLYEYNPATNTWSLKASFPGQARSSTSVFVIDGYAYAGAGKTWTGEFKDFYKYNPGTNTWSQVESINVDIPGNTDCMLAFGINSRGYVEIQRQSTHTFQKYRPTTCNYTIP